MSPQWTKPAKAGLLQTLNNNNYVKFNTTRSKLLKQKSSKV